MFDFDELFSVFWLWVALMAVVTGYVVRIAMMIHRQRRIEAAYRLHIATQVGAAVREQRAQAGEQG